MKMRILEGILENKLLKVGTCGTDLFLFCASHSCFDSGHMAHKKRLQNKK